MHKITLEDRKEGVKTNDGKNKDDNYLQNINLVKKFHLHSSPQEEKKFLFKQRYVSSSRSVPRRNKRFVQCRINRSLNFDTSLHNSSSDSSFDGDKYMTRSAKIMRALNFNSSPSYYGRIKTKRSLNFNLTPSPKRFTRTSRSLPRASSLNFNISPVASNKVLNFDESPSDSPNSSLAFTSSESIDENQNETPLQQNTKVRGLQSFSTPDRKQRRRASNVAGASPLLRSGLRERIDNIVYISGTPNPQSLKCRKTRLRYDDDDLVVSTPRNLLHDFHNEDDDRPCTPENLGRIIPESMSAIKRSHKKERSSRWRERYTEHLIEASSVDPMVSSKESNELFHMTGNTSTPQIPRKYASFSNSGKQSFKNEGSWKGMAFHNSEDDHSDTGSIFDYTEEHENVLVPETHDLRESKSHEELGRNDPGNWSRVKRNGFPKIGECHRLTTDRDGLNRSKSSGISDDDINGEINEGERPRTPDANELASDCVQTVVTPENRLNILQHVLRDSIKKSHKKIKDENKGKFFSPKVLRIKLEDTGEEYKDSYFEKEEESKKKSEMMYSPGNENSSLRKTDGAVTPEKVNSSRLLLSQFSSVKKSHKKDKRNKIISEFMKRQEYFSRDFGSLKNSKKPAILDGSDCRSNTDDSVILDPDIVDSIKNEEIGESVQCNWASNFHNNSDSIDRSNVDTRSRQQSPSKRVKSVDVSLDHNVSKTFSDIELLECDSSKEEFRIFTPLKRKRSLTTTIVKEYSCPYKVPSENNELSEEVIVDIGLSRCLTPVASFQDTRVKSADYNITGLDFAEKFSSQEKDECISEIKMHDNSSEVVDLSGRSTPKNMSTAELYCNIDSIKKSHKKNKCANSLRKSLSANDANESCRQRKSRDSIPADLEMSDLRSSSESIDLNRENDWIESSATGRSASNAETKAGTAIVYENLGPATSQEENPITPPDCLKTKSYIRLLQDTSIKRSHKKVRDQKKYEFMTETHNLSDDGSIFGDEERMLATELDESGRENDEGCDKSIQIL